MSNVSVHFMDSSGFLGLSSERQTIRAADGVSLDIREDDVVTLIGESDCGKSTLEKVIISVQEPTHDSIIYRGQDIWKVKNSRGPDIPFSEIRRLLQIIHQDPSGALNPNQRILTSLMLPLKKWNPSLGEGERRKCICTLPERAGLTPAEDFVERFPRQLSDGEKQRAVLVWSLFLSLDVILTDEAISALGVGLRVEMMDLILELQGLPNISYIFISHDLSNAWYITKKSDGHITVMYLGRIVKVGSMEQIINDPRCPYTQALKWATPSLYERDEGDNLPIRKVNIPGPTNQPSGCHFHPRCPKVREVYETDDPGTFEDETGHTARCFRTSEDHEYWGSPNIVDDRTGLANAVRGQLLTADHRPLTADRQLLSGTTFSPRRAIRAGRMTPGRAVSICIRGTVVQVRMSVDASRVPSLRKATASSRDFIVTALTDACMILLVYFVLNGTIAGMFDAWGVSLVDVTTGGYLLLRLWGVHN